MRGDKVVIGLVLLHVGMVFKSLFKIINLPIVLSIGIILNLKIELIVYVMNLRVPRFSYYSNYLMSELSI